jgi:hypothetical protein
VISLTLTSPYVQLAKYNKEKAAGKSEGAVKQEKKKTKEPVVRMDSEEHDEEELARLSFTLKQVQSGQSCNDIAAYSQTAH